MNHETSKIANSILRGKQNGDYIIKINNEKESLQDYLALQAFISSVSLPLINSHAILSGIFSGINSISTGGIYIENVLHDFEKDFLNKKNFLEDDIKKFVVDEFNKYSFSDFPEFKSSYFSTLGTLRELITFEEKSLGIKPKEYSINYLSNVIIPGLTNILESNPLSILDTPENAEHTYRRSLEDNMKYTQFKLEHNFLKSSSIIETSKILNKTLSKLGHELRAASDVKKTNDNIYQPNNEVIDYLKNNQHNLMM